MHSIVSQALRISCKFLNLKIHQERKLRHGHLSSNNGIQIDVSILIFHENKRNSVFSFAGANQEVLLGQWRCVEKFNDLTDSHVDIIFSANGTFVCHQSSVSTSNGECERYPIINGVYRIMHADERECSWVHVRLLPNQPCSAITGPFIHNWSVSYSTAFFLNKQKVRLNYHGKQNTT